MAFAAGQKLRASELNDLAPSAWTDLPLVGGAVLSHDPGAGQPKCQYRSENKRGFQRGWAYSSGGIAANTAVTTALPASMRPTAFATVWAVRSDTNGLTRLDVQTTGIMTCITAIPAGVYLNLNLCTWPLG